MSITTRRMKTEDHAEVLTIAPALPEWFDDDACKRAIPVDIRHNDAFVALVDDRVVGFMTLYIAEGRLHIGWLGVRPEYHRKGIGRQLLTCAEQYARGKGLNEISVYTTGEGSGAEFEPYNATRAFYFANGFSVFRTSQTDNPNCPEEIEITKTVGRATDR